ncbi:MAG: hypothetical protein AAFY48_10555 [Bacteroidota bacterium]
MINEDIEIIDDETESLRSSLREIFSSMDKYRIGENMFSTINSVEFLTVQMQDKLDAAYEKRNHTPSEYLKTEYEDYKAQLLMCMENYLRKTATHINFTEAEIEGMLVSLESDLSYPQKFQVKNRIVDLKMLESQIIRNQHEIVSRISNMYSYHHYRYPFIFPAILDFGDLRPIQQHRETKVKIGVQSYDSISDSDPFELVILGDTLQFAGPNPYIEYVLPTQKKGDNKLLVTLLTTNQLTGEVSHSEVTFEYYVNE